MHHIDSVIPGAVEVQQGRAIGLLASMDSAGFKLLVRQHIGDQISLLELGTGEFLVNGRLVKRPARVIDSADSWLLVRFEDSNTGYLVNEGKNNG